MSQQKRKILLSAFTCHPHKGSEEGVGWNWLKELSKEHEVYALISNFLDQEAPVRAAVEQLPQRDNIHLTFIPVPPASQRMMAILPQFEFYNLCVAWQKQALIVAKQLMQTIEIDLVHHVTYGSWLIPSYLWQLPKPFVLGPVTGSQRMPWVGYSFLTLKGIAQELARMTYFIGTRLISRAAREAVKQADLVLCGNLETLTEIRRIRPQGQNALFLDVGSSHEFGSSSRETDFQKSHAHNAEHPSGIAFLWAGLMEPRKNFGLLLEALQRIPPDIHWKLIVAGDGPLLPYWKEQVLRLGFQNQIHFLGQLPYVEMANYYRTSDIFVFPSLREGTGTVILEAMAHQLPAIALNMNGAATVLSDNCGVLVEVGNRQQMVADLADAMIRLSRDPQLRRKIGSNARARVQSQYTWEQRGEQIKVFYQDVLDAPTKTR